MELQTAREKFIQAWGTLGSSWGINRTMAQIHALLMIAPEPLSAEEIMEELNISRGNANMNIRALIEWNIVFKEYKSGERKEFFVAEKDIWQVAKQIARGRRKRELEPVLKVLDQVKEVAPEKTPEYEEFNQMTKDIEGFAKKSDRLLDQFVRADEHWFFGSIMKLVK